MQRKPRIRVMLNTAGVVAPLLFALVVVVCARAYPGYVHAQRAISDLGTPWSPWGPVMNALGFGLVGFLVVAFALGLAVSLEPSGVTLAAAAAWSLVGVLFIGLGYWPFPTPTHVELVSVLAAWLAVALVVSAVALARQVRSNWLFPMTFLAVAASLGQFVLPVFPPASRGVVQRTCAAAIGCWVIMAAVHIDRIDNLRSNSAIQRPHSGVTSRAKHGPRRPAGR